MGNLRRKIRLDEGEQKVARLIAESRYASNRRSGVRNCRIGPQSDIETDLNGIAAEMAFCKMLNCYPDFSIDPRSAHSGEDDGDASLFGHRVDVKTTKYQSGRLLVLPRKHRSGITLYALMKGSFPEYEFCGVIEADELIVPETLTDLGHGPTHVMNQSDLKDFKQIDLFADSEKR